MTLGSDPGSNVEAPRTSDLRPRTSDLFIREVWDEDNFEIVLQLRDEVFVHEQQLTDDARTDPDDESSIHFLATREGRPVGTGRLTMYGREAQVAWVAVRLDERGTGVGLAIMEAIIERARAEGAGYVMLNAQTHAIEFYRRLGFELVGTEFFMGGIGHFVMMLRF
jgi:predicted GNAT family N-acyltransferase